MKIYKEVKKIAGKVAQITRLCESLMFVNGRDTVRIIITDICISKPMFPDSILRSTMNVKENNNAELYR